MIIDNLFFEIRKNQHIFEMILLEYILIVKTKKNNIEKLNIKLYQNAIIVITLRK